MGKITFSELVNLESLKNMTENLYEASGIPVGIIDIDGNICVKTGWQEICTKFHRVHPHTCNRCIISDRYIKDHLLDEQYIDKQYIEYKCLNNMWEIGVPLIVAGEHIATIFLGQFFYDDEYVDKSFFFRQAIEFGFDDNEYLKALDSVPRFSRKKVNHIIEYYRGVVMTLAESGLRLIENRSTQQALAINQKYLDTIYNSVNDAIIIHDFNGDIIDVNQTVTTIFGYSSNELVKMNIKDLMSENSSVSKQTLFETIEKARYSKREIIEGLCKTKNNHELWIEVNISVVTFGNEEEVIATARDITSRKLSELAHNKEAQEMENLRSEFFANISHELRTPLNIIFGTVQMMELELGNRDKPINREKLSNNLSIEKQNCYRLLRLINNLIDSTKLDAGYDMLNLVNCNIVSIVEDITLSVADYIAQHNLSLTFDTDVEEKLVACDQDKLERIMLNLLSNAVKFTPKGGKIFVNIYDNENYVTITVKDTGIGIPSHKQDIIFDRFRQVDKSLARSYEGSGIGLSLVKSLVEMHGGSITAESRFGHGTKFSLRFPVEVLASASVGIGVDVSEKTDSIKESTISNYIERIKIEFSDIYK